MFLDIFFIHIPLLINLIEYIFEKSWDVSEWNLFSNFDANGFINTRIIIPKINIDNDIGLKISKIEYPIFLIEINSLLLIKFLNIKEIAIIITKGIVSEIIVGIFKQDNRVFEVPNGYTEAPIDQLDDVNDLLKLMVKRV